MQKNSTCSATHRTYTIKEMNHMNNVTMTLTKSLVEKNGFKSGDEVVAKYQEGKITITAKK